MQGLTRRALLTACFLFPRFSLARLKEALIKNEEPNFELLTEFGVDRILAGQTVGTQAHLVTLVEKRPRLNPLLLSPPTPGCDEENLCYVRVTADGALSVYLGFGPADPDSQLLRQIVEPDREPRERELFPVLTLGLGGNLQLHARYTDVPLVLWSSNTPFPAKCLPETACSREAHVSLLPDGSLALFLGLSAAAEAYLDVALPAIRRLEGCLWHNDFTGEGVDTPRTARAIASGRCYVPPVLSLAAFPSSGATFAMDAVAATTASPVFTSSPVVISGDVCHRMKGGYRYFCGKDSWGDYGMCPVPLGNTTEHVPVGKGALVKNHVLGEDREALCSWNLFEEGLLMSDNGKTIEPYGFVRLFRNPFDNLVGRMGDLADAGVLSVPYNKHNFLSRGGIYPQHEIWVWLYWHLNANLALRELNKPTAVFTYQDMDNNQPAFVRRILAMLGYTEVEISPAKLREMFKGPLGPYLEEIEHRFRYGDEDLPVHIDFYDPATVHYIAAAINEIIDGSASMTRPYCVVPPGGFRDGTDILFESKDAKPQAWRDAEGGI